MDEIEPPYDDESKRPKTLTRNRHIDEVLYVAGRKPIEEQEQYDIMFVTTSVDEEEATQQRKTTFGFTVSQPAEYLKGPTGIIKDIALRCGIDMDKCYYTALCKWLLPRIKRTKPPMKTLRWGMPILMDEIKRVKPKIIVCLGKQVFDLLSDTKVGFDDAHGGWFWSTEANAHLYVMYAPGTLIGKPDLYEHFRVDFTEIERKRRILDGDDINDIPVRFEVIRDEQALRDWVDYIDNLDPWPGLFDDEGNKLIGVDCEWHGRQHVDGQLRTIQFAWTESDAVVLEFRNEKNEWSFEFGEPRFDDPMWAYDDKMNHGAIMRLLDENGQKGKYKLVGSIISPVLNKPTFKWVGHHYAADAPWMDYWLDLETYQKCAMDTEFAQQTVDEASELKLERGIGMKYTTLGLYNQELVMWKKANKALCEDGYGYIPSKILHPYGARDVIAPLRAYPKIKRQLQAQQLWDYYRTIHNPFVTDTFASFCQVGLPMDVPLMEDLRVLFHFVREQLEAHLKERIHNEAKAHIMGHLMDEVPVNGLKIAVEVLKQVSADAALAMIKPVVQLENIPKWISRVNHLFDSKTFNIRSPDQMRAWLFDIEGLEPIKTTNQKAKGLPSMSWEKVLDLPPERQRLYTPAVDKQTLQILSMQLDTVDELLNLNAVGNLCKAFLKEADVWFDEETGEEVIEENGLFQWIAEATKRIHGQTSCTGTSRPRTWAPNTLNIPKYVNMRIALTTVRVLRECHERGELPEHLMKWLGKTEKELPSLRSCIKAPPGWCFVESDYKTAEMHALAAASGDVDLRRILNDPDPEWAVLKKKMYGASFVRIAFSDTADSGIPERMQNPDMLMHVWKEGKMLGPVSEDDLARNADGSVKCRGYDIHWSIAERIYETPRELMVEDIHRAAGKVINFCLAEGQPVLTNRGWIPIEQLLPCDLLWDGVEWCSHAGLHYSGEREVRLYGGLWATPGHNVWTDRGKIKFERARLEQAGLIEIGRAGQTTDCHWPDHLPGNHSENGAGLLRGSDGVPVVQQAGGEGSPEHGEGNVEQVQMPTWRGTSGLRYTDGDLEVPRVAIQRDDTAVLQGHARVDLPLSGAGHRGGVPESQGVHPVGAGEVAERDIQAQGLRQGGQQRELLEGQPSAGLTLRQFVEQEKVRLARFKDGAGVLGETPGGDLHGQHVSGSHAPGHVGGGDSGASQTQQESRMAKTYDILNVGPRRRFVCAGVLVSNSSAYGASPASLERKIESDTGVKPPPGTGQKGLDAIKQRQPRATEYLEEMGNIPKGKGYYRAASGRVCHCNTHSAGSGVGWRTRNSIESALGRELKNYPMQESVASTSARACIWGLELYRQLGMQARTITCLYDSLVTMCPLEERFVVSKLHQAIMSDMNAWVYDDQYGKRTLRYEIDTDLHYRWSTKLRGTEADQLADTEWHPTPDRLKWTLTCKNWDMFVS